MKLLVLLVIAALMFTWFGFLIYRRGVSRGKGGVVSVGAKALREGTIYRKICSAAFQDGYAVVLYDTIEGELVSRIMPEDPPAKFQVVRRGISLVPEPLGEHRKEDDSRE